MMTNLGMGIPLGTCEGKSCLKWEANGELAELDRGHILEMLCSVDPANCPIPEWPIQTSLNKPTSDSLPDTAL